MLLGLAVGVAQLFKYNGWLAGAVVVLSAAVWLALHPAPSGGPGSPRPPGDGASSRHVVAALVYWPWFAFVESHGGYAALLAHQRGYLGGFASWPGHLAVQLAQARALSGGADLARFAGLAAAAAILLIGFDSADRESHGREIILLITLVVAALRVTPDLAWWVPLFWLPLRSSRGTNR